MSEGLDAESLHRFPALLCWNSVHPSPVAGQVLLHYWINEQLVIVVVITRHQPSFSISSAVICSYSICSFKFKSEPIASRKACILVG